MKKTVIIKSITNRESYSLDKYFQEIGKYNLLTKDEEIELSKKIKDISDRESINKLINSNLRFVITVVKQYQNQGLPLLDLISEGNLGLIKAANKFDYSKGVNFISYAVWWIRQSILKAIGDQSRLVRIPLNKRLLVNKIEKIYFKNHPHSARPTRPAGYRLFPSLSYPQIHTIKHCLHHPQRLPAGSFPIDLSLT